MGAVEEEARSCKRWRWAPRESDLEGRFCGLKPLTGRKESFELSEVSADHRSRAMSADSPVMEDEIVTAMRLLGVRRIDEIKPGMVECLQEIWK